MKKIIFSILIMCLIVVGCKKYEFDLGTPGIYMDIKEGSLTNTGATIIITDVTGRDNIYGEEYRIDKKENDKWVELDIIVEGDYGWNLIGYSVGEDEKLELVHNWEWLYGKLDKGKYRLVKNTSVSGEDKKHYFSVEFEIE